MLISSHCRQCKALESAATMHPSQPATLRNPFFLGDCCLMHETRLLSTVGVHMKASLHDSKDSTPAIPHLAQSR